MHDGIASSQVYVKRPADQTTAVSPGDMILLNLGQTATRSDVAIDAWLASKLFPAGTEVAFAADKPLAMATTVVARLTGRQPEASRGITRCVQR